MAKTTTVSAEEVSTAFAVLAALLGGATIETPEPEEDAPAPTRGRGRAKAKDEPEPEPDEDEDTDEDEDEEDGGDEEGGDTYSRDELEAMGLRELKALAKESGWTVAELKGQDKDSLVEWFLGDESEEDDEDAEEDEDEDGDELTEDDLNEMSLAELKSLAKEEGITFRASITQEALVKKIMDAIGEDE